MAALYKEFLEASIGIVEQENALGSLSVAARTSDFLVVGLDRARQMIVNDKSNVVFVDTHPESVGCYDGLPLSAHEAFLCTGAFAFIHPGVIGLNHETGHLQLGRDLFDSLASCGVDDARAIGFADNSFDR